MDDQDTLISEAADLLYGLGLSGKTQELPAAPRAVAVGRTLLGLSRSARCGDVHDVLLAVVRQHLGLATLTSAGSDQADIHEHALWQIEAALRAAYELGFAAGRQGGGDK